VPGAQRARLANPDMLRWARETAGYSPEDIARIYPMGRGRTKSPEEIVAWEAGEGAPTFRQLEKFAHKVKRSVAVLYLPEPPERERPPRDFRRLPHCPEGHFSPDARLAFRQLRNALGDLADVLGALGQRLQMDLPELDTEGLSPSAALTLRERLAVTLADVSACDNPYAALSLWVDALYGRGVVVQRFAVDPSEVRGFSLIEQDLGGIGVSSGDAPVARVFSVLHEVGHLCLRSPGVSGDAERIPATDRGEAARVERACNAFAAEVLLPRSSRAVARALGDAARLFDDRSVGECARQFWVSRYVVARRMLDLGLVDLRAYRAAVGGWRAGDALQGKPEGGNYYRGRVSGLGRPYVATVLEAADRGAISSVSAAAILGVRPAHLPRLRAELVGEADA
jgi:Zn-dependent peptidase ImmA (M78 family)